MSERRPPPLREWLAPAIPGSRLLGWLGPLLIATFAAVLRFDRIGTPREIVFDETYYAKDGLALLKFGYEVETIDNPNTKQNEADEKLLGNIDQHGNVQDPNIDIWKWAGLGDDQPVASFVAHPPGGKWTIAIGEYLFGPTPLGWRFAAAVIGALSVLVLARVARRMTRSTLLGCAAGLLLALDGLHFVTSRTALLDIFVMFWVLAGFACLVADRDFSRWRLADNVSRMSAPDLGPFVMHWWRILAGVCLGMACATKWTGIYYVAVFGIMTLIWDMGARRAAGVRRPYLGGLALDAGPAFLQLVGAAFVTYVASWSGWIFRPGGWGRGQVSDLALLRPFEALPELVKYHLAMWQFHTDLSAGHPYKSNPWDWVVLKRPVAFFYNEPKRGELGCAVDKCSREILGIGTPAIWWGALVCLFGLIVWWLLARDWRAGAVLAGFAAGWLPWFVFAADKRTMFIFYATPLIPFLVLAIVLVLGLLIGPANGPPPLRWFGTVAAGVFVLLVIANFAYLHPIMTARVIPWEDWYAKMWLDSWV
jgi:dolichyl-phosphate-mannose-protein mannosyltransferase